MAARPGQIRIIGGLLRRTPLAVVGAVPGMRPTPDRVRETLFNWIGERVQGARCLDLFAGTGALGLEAASRGAASVLFNERNGRAAGALAARIASLSEAADPAVQALAGRLALLRRDAFETIQSLARQQQQFDIVFLDPPFAEDWSGRLAEMLAPVLSAGALVYLEADHELADLSCPPALSLARVRHASAGQVHYHLFERAPERAETSRP